MNEVFNYLKDCYPDNDKELDIPESTETEVKKELSEKDKKVEELKEELFGDSGLKKNDHKDNAFVTSKMGYSLATTMTLCYRDEESGKYQIYEDSRGKVLQERLKDKVFFDLGCGDLMSRDRAIRFAGVTCADKYVGVDIDLEGKKDDFFKKKRKGVEEGDMDCYLFESDMLDFVSSVKDGNGGTMFISGIEDCYPGENYEGESPEWGKEIKKYLDKLFEEIYRVLNKGDVMIVGVQSIVYRSGDFDKKFREVKSDVINNPGTKIYEKI